MQREKILGCSQGGKASEFGSEIKGSSPFIPDFVYLRITFSLYARYKAKLYNTFLVVLSACKALYLMQS